MSLGGAMYDFVPQTLKEALDYAFAYNVAGSMVMDTKVTDPRGNVSTYRFNGLGDWARLEDALGRSHAAVSSASGMSADRRISGGGITWRA